MSLFTSFGNEQGYVFVGADWIGMSQWDEVSVVKTFGCMCFAYLRQALRYAMMASTSLDTCEPRARARLLPRKCRRQSLRCY